MELHKRRPYLSRSPPCPPPSHTPPRRRRIKTSHTVMLPPLRPHRKEKMSFWQAAGSQTASPVLLTSHQGFVRQACSEPRAFKTPIMQQDSAGQKEQECFRQSCGHTGIIHSSVALWIFCESYKQKARGKRPAKTARSFDNWELYKFRKSSQEDLKFFFYSPLPSFFFPPFCLPHCVFAEKPRAKVPLRR